MNLCNNNLVSVIISTCNVQKAIFAYPFGKFDKNSITAAKLANLDACCTTASGTVSNTSNLYTMNRIQIGNWNIDELVKQLKKVSINAFA